MKETRQNKVGDESIRTVVNAVLLLQLPYCEPLCPISCALVIVFLLLIYLLNDPKVTRF